MDIQKDQALTPEKKQLLVEQIKSELSQIGSSIKQRQYGSAAFMLLQQSQQDLQNILNKILDKKGVITPSETNNALDVLGTAKKARLEEEYIMGMRKATFYLVAFGILSVATYLLIKRKKK